MASAMSRGLWLRLACWYGASIGALSFLPFLGVALAEAGLSDAAAAAALALLPAGTLLAAPAWAWVADRTGKGLAVLRGATAGAAVVVAVLAATQHAWVLVLGVAAYATCKAPIHPIADALTVRALGEARRDYGRIRAAGSVVFVGAVLVGGPLRDELPRAPMWVAAALLAIAAGLAWTLPDRASSFAPPTLGTLAAALRHPVLAPVLGAATLNGMALAGYDMLFALHIERSGLPGTVTGSALALGVTCEVGVLLAGAPLMARFGPKGLLLASVAVGIPRFLLTGLGEHPVLLVGTQALHGLQFGGFWVSGIALVSEHAPRSLAHTAQALFAACGWGIGYLLSMLIASVVLSVADTAVLFTGLAGVSALAVVVAARIRAPAR